MDEKSMNIQWYPGHMTKTRRIMEEDLKLVDAVCEILDARIPISSRNPDIDTICGSKPRMIILNRIDMADPALVARWSEYFKRKGWAVIQTDCKSRKGINQFAPAVRTLLAEKLARYAEKGQVGRPLKLMVVGIPNVGKSTFINSFAGTTRATAANKPGVTRGKQWISVDSFDLMDMPGVLWKKFDSLETASNLAFIGSIRDDILDIEELACGLLSSVRGIYPQQLLARYKLDAEALTLPPYDLLQAIGAKRGMLISGGEVDTERAAKMLVGEFRASKWGRLSLERPPRRAIQEDMEEVTDDAPQDDDWDDEQ